MKHRNLLLVCVLIVALESHDKSLLHAQQPIEGRLQMNDVSLASVENYVLEGVASAGSRFFAVGSRRFHNFAETTPKGPGIILVSTNGRSWRVIQTNELGFHSIAAAAGRIVVTADAGSIFVSSDGERWMTANSSGTDALRGVVYGNGLWVAVGDRGSILTSSDAENWAVLNEAIGSRFHLTAVAFGDGRFVAVGGDHLAYAFCSSDGLKWTRTPLQPSSIPFAVAYGNGRFIAIGNALRTYLSTNGQDWRSTEHVGMGGRSLTYAQGRFLAAGDGGIFSSHDGLTWVSDFPLGAFSRPSSLLDIAYADGNYVAVGYQLSGTDLGALLLQAEGSKPLLDHVEVLDGSIAVSFSGGTESSYVAEVSTKLDVPSWSRIGEVSTTDGVGVIEDQNVSQFPQRFYRLSPSKSTPLPTE
jgi:hypothetical protein